MKNILRRLLLAYRPIDDRLRQVRIYANLSRSLQQRYNVFMASRNISADQDAAGQAYSRNFSTIAPRQDTLLFECYWGKKFGDNPLAIYRALMRSQPANHFRIYWVTSPEGEFLRWRLREIRRSSWCKPDRANTGLRCLRQVIW